MTDTNRLADLLAPFRASAPPAGMADAVQTDLARAILRVWPSLPVSLHPPLFLGGVPEHAPNRWRYAWRFRDVPWADLEGRLSGWPAADVRAATQRLIEARLLFPDGSVHPAVPSGDGRSDD